MDFKNAFDSLKRDKTLDSAYSQTSHLFFGDKGIQSQEGCQRGNPEGPALFTDTIKDVNQKVSQYNVWYLDDRSLSGDYRTVLENLKRTIASADEYGFSLGKTKGYIIFLGHFTYQKLKKENQSAF